MVKVCNNIDLPSWDLLPNLKTESKYLRNLPPCLCKSFTIDLINKKLLTFRKILYYNYIWIIYSLPTKYSRSNTSNSRNLHYKNLHLINQWIMWNLMLRYIHKYREMLYCWDNLLMTSGPLTVLKFVTEAWKRLVGGIAFPKLWFVVRGGFQFHKGMIFPISIKWMKYIFKKK